MSTCQCPGGTSRGDPRRGIGAPPRTHAQDQGPERSDPRTDGARRGVLAGHLQSAGPGTSLGTEPGPRPGHSRGLLTHLGQHGPLGALQERVRSTWGRYADRLLAAAPGAPASVRGRGHRRHASHGALLKKGAARSGVPGQGGPGPQVPRSPKSQVLGPGLGSGGPGAFPEGEECVGRVAPWAVGRPGAICGAQPSVAPGGCTELADGSASWLASRVWGHAGPP